MKQCQLSQACCSLNENTILELCLLTVIPRSDLSFLIATANAIETTQTQDTDVCIMVRPKI
jgi:hypothetical protein